MAEKSIIIIGAGVAGLCTGIYAQMNGYRTRIVEQHSIPGGLVTAWKRKGFLIDICVHWLVGSGPGIFLNRYWNEVGLLEGRKFIHSDRYMVYRGKDGREFNLYCDPDRLEQHMLDLSPRDAPAIRELVAGVRFGNRFNPPEKERYEAGTLGWMKFIFGMMPLLGELQKWQKVTIGELASRFQDPLLREGLSEMLMPEISALFALTTLGYVFKKQGGYPIGGSLPLALFLEKRYKQLGGEVQYHSKVKKVLVGHDRAVGIQLENEERLHADVVVSAADGRSTLFQMLDGKFVDESTQKRYQSWKTLPQFTYASFGVNRIFSEVPNAVEGNIYELTAPVMIAGEQRSCIDIRFHGQDSSFAPAGKTVLTVVLATEYSYWKNLKADQKMYDAEKDATVKAILEALEQIWPGISKQVEMSNVATPLTIERYTANWKGSITGWALIPGQASVNIPKTLPGLDNFWMVGQWVYPGGGLPSGVSTAREAVWRQCKKDRKQFIVKANHLS
jgi:phytoene dehydrogenase-like protein